MKNRVTVFIALFICVQSWSQASRHAVINSAGGSSNNGYYQFEWSVGEAALIDQMNAANNSLTLTNGFIQPYMLFPGIINTHSKFGAEEIRIFPNPSTKYVEVNISTKQKGLISIVLFDMIGHNIYSKELDGFGVDIIERIPLEHLAQGSYSLYVALKPLEGSVAKSSSYTIIRIQN